MILENPNGITVKQLIEFCSQLSQEEYDGEEGTVWIGTPDGTSNMVTQICELNQNDVLIYHCNSNTD